MTQHHDNTENQRIPLWQSVQNDLRARIARGDFLSDVPGELALSEHYAVSRATIRSALGPLRREGLISSHPGRPSKVINVADEHHFGPVYSLFAAVEKAGMTQRSQTDASAVVTDPNVAARLGLKADEPLAFIRRTRFADEEAIAVDDTWLPLSLAEPVLHADLRRTALYQVLRDHCGITLTAGRETLHSVAADAEQAHRLDCAPGTALFFIERLGIAAGGPVEWRETLIRGDRFTVTTAYPTA